MEYGPIPSKYMFKALADKPCIIMACNTRYTKGIVKGLMRAAKDIDAPIIFELAKSECDLNGGYTGLTPAEYAKRTKEAAQEVGFDLWALHGDHIGVKKGTDEELVEVKKLIDAQIIAGYTSFAIDASHLFDLSAVKEKEQLKDNIRCTVELAKHIKQKMDGKDFGLEVEVGEIGKKDKTGAVVTTVKEAVTYITELKKAGIDPDALAIANGSTHGNIYDEAGNPIEQISINIERTKEIASALKKEGYHVRIAQHGITGTPRQLIATRFPHGDIIKGNVGTFWQNVYFDCIKICRPDFYKKIWDWVMEIYGKDEKRPIEIFGKNAKRSFKQFFDEHYDIDSETEHAIESHTYSEALLFMRAFKCKGTGRFVREYIQTIKK